VPTRRRIASAAAGLAALLLTASLAPAQWVVDDEEEPAGEWRQWDAVQRLRGEAVIESHSTIDWVPPGIQDHDRSSAWLTVSFVLEREEVEGIGRTTFWRAVSLAVSGGQTMTQNEVSTTRRHTASESGTYAETLADPGVMEVTVDHETGHWETSTPASLEQPFTVSGRRSTWLSYTGRTETEAYDYELTSIPAMAFSGDAPKQLLPLAATWSSDSEDAERGSRTHTEGHITLYPEYDDFELVVTVPGRDRWRPLGSIENPAEPGNAITARAELRPKGRMSGPPPRGRKITFELLRTSREPGVCMNWPNGAGGRRDGRAEAEGMYEGIARRTPDRSPDLRLAAGEPAWGKPGEEGQTLEVANPPVNSAKLPFAAARIDSFDFGGRADLRVTCELADGRIFLGTLEGAPPGPGTILLPKREPGAWIPDSWREANQLGGPADGDDDEEEPEGDGAPGDGLTLYEEYRGFVVGGERIEGDPARKDFFIQNQMGGKAQGGIDLFAQLTGLQVHDRLTDREFDFRDRLVNGNTGKGPHRVDQHGVFIVENDSVSGAKASFWEGTGHGRPGLTTGISVSPQSVLWEIEEQNVSEADRARALDRAVAHELLHTVGVEHHGEGSQRYNFVLRPPGDPENPTDKPIFTWGHPVRLLHEETGQDMAELFAAGWRRGPGGELVPGGSTLEERTRWERESRDRDIEGIQKNWRLTREQATRKLEELQRFTWPLDYLVKEHFLVGMPGDEHSGDDRCVMRYYFADIYPALGRDDLFYYVPAGTEPAGLGLCTEARGTGVNDPDHEPQSRYGDATNGACAESVHVSDAER